MTERRSLLIRTGLAALIVLGLAVLMLVVVNLGPFDQEPDPALRAAIASRSDGELSADHADNAVVFLLGLTAASDREPVRAGAERLTADGPEAASDSASLDQAWLDRYPAASCNARSQLACLDRLDAALSRTPIQDPRVERMLERYRAVRRLPTFDETPVLPPGSFPQPEYAMALRLARLSIALRLQQGGIDAALDDLLADRRFWERMLSDSESMLARMVAVAGLWTDLQFASELVATGTLTSEQLGIAREIVAPLPAPTLNLESVFATEQQGLPNSLDALRAQSPPLRRLFLALTLQPNATLNRFNRELTQPMMALASLHPVEFRRRVDEGVEPDFGFRVFPPGLYNLGGTVLLQAFRSHRSWEYIGRVHDLAGMLGLVRLQIAIAGAGAERESGALDQAAIQRWIQASPERDPYSGEPVRFDRAARALSFDCFGDSICQIRL